MTGLCYIEDEAGAVTVDWVVLTAGVVGLGLATMAVVSGGVEDLSNDIDAALTHGDTNRIIKSSFTLPGPFVIDNETMSGITPYGETGSSIEASDTLGSVSGDNAYVITSSLLDDNGIMAGGLYIDNPGGLTIGETYRVSYWARAETGEVGVRSFTYSSDEEGNWVSDPGTANNATIGEEWQYVEHEFTATDQGERLFIATNNLGVTYAVDDISVEMLN